MNDRIPFSATNFKTPLGCHIPKNEFIAINGQGWLPLLEKVVAVVMDGYQNLSGGFPHCALEARLANHTQSTARRRHLPA